MGRSLTDVLELAVLRLAALTSGNHFVIARWDGEAQVWYVHESSIPGLSIEAESRAALLGKLETAVPELLSLNEAGRSPGAAPGRRIPLRTIFEEDLRAA